MWSRRSPASTEAVPPGRRRKGQTDRMRGSRGPLVAVDLAALQAGYKAHLERGIGRHARGLVRSRISSRRAGSASSRLSGPEPDLDGESVPVEFLLWPRWIERVPAGRETAFRLPWTVIRQGSDVRVAHFLPTRTPLGRLGGTRLVVPAHDIIPVAFRKEYAG